MNNSPRASRIPPRFRNWVSLSGIVLVIASVFAFVLLFAIDLIATQSNPYMGILAYVVAPAFHLAGWILVWLGVRIHRRHEAKAEAANTPHVLTFDFSRPRDRKLLAIFSGGVITFLLATALGSYETYHYSESVTFCGQACHEPMKPEFTAYLNSPHARVQCVECHVGSGASYYVKAKLNGVHQLYGQIFGNYSRPIKTPVKNMRPAQETCEQCHWPSRNAGNLDRTYTHFLADETNTTFSVRLILKVGGGDARNGAAGGIHWHMNLDNRVEFVARDEKKQDIPWVRITHADGKVEEFKKADFKDDPAAHTLRKMDCMDCHNRPAHQYSPPNQAVDLAMATGKIDPSMTWVKSNAVQVLTGEYRTEPEALQTIATTLQKKYPNHPKTGALIAAVQAIYQRNFFPEMKADWRAYPDNIGHKDWPGCFRCHDGLHKTAGGKKTLSATDCNSCHTILAQGVGAELEKLNPKGFPFIHLDAEYSDFSCNKCHTGTTMK